MRNGGFYSITGLNLRAGEIFMEKTIIALRRQTVNNSEDEKD